mmetsp:Transcript_24640/g.52532  ORF Transcript_24640/g.52532 Transcript_24640/m.52532 type:complete len:193 (+) Transcript_24640:51-629(+)
MPSTGNKPLIRYYLDYDPKEEAPEKTYQINTPNGREYIGVRISHGESIEELMHETYEGLEEVNGAGVNPWNGVQRFRELRAVIKGKPRGYFDEIVLSDYPTNADKTDANYVELRCKIITHLSDHPYPGDKIHVYIMGGVKYNYCKMEDGRLEKPNTALAHLKHLRKLGSEMHQNQGAQYMTDDQLTKAFWNM